MASSLMSSVTTAAPVTSSRTNLLASVGGLRTSISYPVTRKSNATVPAGKPGKVQCMLVWPPEGNRKFETLSYLPTLSNEELIKEVEYLIRNGWIPCIEFSKVGFVFREHNSSPGYYDGRYWTMWKLPMFGCTDAVQVLNEVEECKKAYPDYFNRIIGFDNKRQVQCVSFISYKPPSFKGE